jgi:hypothetical protein
VIIVALPKIPAIIRLRRGTAPEWEDANPILEDGEPGLATTGPDAGKIKVGDGVTPWNNLRFTVRDGVPQNISAAANTLEPGNQATVERSGTIDNILLTFGIPKGDKGDGIINTAYSYASSTSGTVAPAAGWQPTIPNVDAGSYLWVRIILTYSNNTTTAFYIVLKQWGKGDTGSTPSITPLINMLPAESKPSVEKTGTNENPVFTFNIPRGFDGGVTAPVDGWFTLNVDANGDLWCTVNEPGTNPFEYDAETGELFFVINN